MAPLADTIGTLLETLQRDGNLGQQLLGILMQSQLLGLFIGLGGIVSHMVAVAQILRSL